ncbi:MAG: AAA family ATPase, partial [Candidatus Diapherotrites archaeon]|nr:AAA family ATPase [Candidatus Diapherotrites archaeon]
YGLMHALVLAGNESRELFAQQMHSKVSKFGTVRKWFEGRVKKGDDLHWPNISPLLKRIKQEKGLSYGKNLPEGPTERYISGRDPLTRRKLQEISGLLGRPPELERLANAEIAWTRIDSIRQEGEKELFDFTVEPFNNFLAGHSLLVMHNSKFVGEAEERIRQVFKEAEDNAPSIIFFDEIDAIAPKRDEVVGEVERRVVAQLLASMDGMEARGNVIVIAATNRIDSIDEALRRPGRFDREIEFPVPGKIERRQVLLIHTRGMPIHPPFDIAFLAGALEKREDLLSLLKKHPKEKDFFAVLQDKDRGEVEQLLLEKILTDFADITHGFVGADLSALCKESAMKALRRYLPRINLEEETIPPEVLESLEVNKKDFQEALREIQPSALREVTIEVPNVKWSEVGALEYEKMQLKQAVEWPLKNPGAFRRLGIRPPRGVLLYGPPGCGKTLLAKAVATESGANFISVKGPELISMWVGQSEKGVRNIFKKARQVSPCIVFFDEIDSIASHRGGHGDSGVGDRVVNQLLTELDGIVELKDVVFIAATNRPDMIDSGLMRPGRIDKLIRVSAPDALARLAILKVHLNRVPLEPSFEPEKLLDELKKKRVLSAALREKIIPLLDAITIDGPIKPVLNLEVLSEEIKKNNVSALSVQVKRKAENLLKKNISTEDFTGSFNEAEQEEIQKLQNQQFMKAAEAKFYGSLTEKEKNDVRELLKTFYMNALVEKTNGFSGADLEGLVREAALIALQESNLEATRVDPRHFDEAFSKLKPSISNETEEAYDEFVEKRMEYKPTYVE